jgi:DNA-binding LacI/PurR family transcriptional regulator
LHEKRVTIYDIAKKVGVSHTTVALALRNHHRISEKRRQQILQTAAKMGYVPDPLLSALASYRSQARPATLQNTIAWINHWEQPEKLRGQHREFDAYWHGAQQAAQRFGYRLEEIRWEPEFSARRFEQILLTRAIRGMLIPPHHVAPDWGDFDWTKFSIIRFGLSVPSPDSHLVTADQHRAVVMALKKISSYGYERIGMVVAEHLDRNVGGNFSGGFFAAQKLYQVPGVSSLLYSELVDYETKPARARERLQRWLVRTRPDAVLTADTMVADLIRELGYRIPQDIAVAGTGIDVPVDAGVDQHSEAIGRMAVEMLVSQINLNERGEPADPARILIESRWRDGSSLPNKRRRRKDESFTPSNSVAGPDSARSHSSP